MSVPAVETVATQRKLYTQRELKGIEAAKRLMTAYAYPSVKALVKMVRHGKIRNCPVTATDLLNCLDLYGHELARERREERSTCRDRTSRESWWMLMCHFT